MISPKKSLGQHFLQDENVVRKIVGSLALHREDVVVEVGPGRGELTKHLVECSDHVVGVEVDPRAVALLQDTLAGRLLLVEKDVLKVRFEEFSRRYGRKLRVVGNIPYYITSEILFHLFEQRDEVLDATLMMQLEVARRLTAKPRSKEYGILSVFTQFYAKPELLFRVSRNSFYPRPNVDSAVVNLKFE
ncbi:MAG: 16S rRNA (adenine(1518)-N(6)/adenine(1519)-N(6))-dimethyltransferase RsmA, partial [Bacteroidota bacterium]